MQSVIGQGLPVLLASLADLPAPSCKGQERGEDLNSNCGECVAVVVVVVAVTVG